MEGLTPKRYSPKTVKKEKGSQNPGRPPQKTMPAMNIAPVQKRQKTASGL